MGCKRKRGSGAKIAMKDAGSLFSLQRVAGGWIMDARVSTRALVADNFYDHICQLGKYLVRASLVIGWCVIRAQPPLP